MTRIRYKTGGFKRMDIKEGVCANPKCRMPILVGTTAVDGRMQVFCGQCESMFAEMARKALSKAGKNGVKDMKFVFPKVPDSG